MPTRRSNPRSTCRLHLNQRSLFLNSLNGSRLKARRSLRFQNRRLCWSRKWFSHGRALRHHRLNGSSSGRVPSSGPRRKNRSSLRPSLRQRPQRLHLVHGRLRFPRPAAPSTGNAAGSSGSPANWRAALLAQLNRAKRYPSEARSRREEGTVRLTFSIDRSGRVTGYQIAGSSGSATLDQEALSMLQRASPLPAPPRRGARFAHQSDCSSAFQFQLTWLVTSCSPTSC